MEFNKKLQELRRKKGLTQDELGKLLFVSRTAISKWESGRGYPNLDSLKTIARLFGVTVDELLSCNELLSVAEQDGRQKEGRVRDLVYGIIDLSVIVFLFLPFFAVRAGGAMYEASLLLMPFAYTKVAYMALVVAGAIFGGLQLALLRRQDEAWLRIKRIISLSVGGAQVVLFCAGLQPYAAVLAFAFLAVKAIILIRA